MRQILIADDDLLVCETIRAALEDYGSISAVCCTTGAAQQALTCTRFDAASIAVQATLANDEVNLRRRRSRRKVGVL
jgi:CheY-like chemotaxis protein